MGAQSAPGRLIQRRAMTLDSDILIDRRRLKNRLTLWRMLAIVAAVAAIAFAIARSDDAVSSFGFGRDQIARVTVSGFIGDSRARQDILTKFGKTRNVNAIIVEINSPGCSTAGGEELSDVRRAP